MTVPFQCVLDASVAVKVFLPESLQAQAVSLIGCMADPISRLYVPDLFFAECANIFWKQVQRGNTVPHEVEVDLSLLLSWRLEVESLTSLSHAALRLALAYNISAYDGCYAALAQRVKVPLITADEKLALKLAGSSMPVMWLGYVPLVTKAAAPTAE